MTDNQIISSDHRIRVHDRTFRPFIRREEIDEMVDSIARSIDRRLAGQEVVALVILKGAVFFAADLLRRINIPVTIEFVRAASYGNSMVRSGATVLDGLTADLSGQNVLIIEDIIDTGTTVTDIIAHLGGQGPKSITVAALLSKPQMQAEPVAVDFVGREIAPDFVVGYGMDYAGQGRHLDAIWVLASDEPA